MAMNAKTAWALVVIAGLGLAQWKYDIAHTLLNKLQPPATREATAATTPSQGGGAGAKRAAPPVIVKLAQSKKADFPLIERSYGTMASPQVVGINARIASQIVKVNVQDGQMVKAGDVLVELDDRTLQATLAKDEATLAKDQAALPNLDIQLNRAKTLFAKNAGPQADVDNAIAAQKAGQQVVSADQAVIDADKLQLEFAKITAPFDGKLGTISATVGALVSASSGSAAQTALMTITQMQPLKVNFRLPQNALDPIRARMDQNQPVIVRVYASGTHDLLDQGNLNFIDSAVDTASGTVGFGADMVNAKLALWPGEQVQVEAEHGSITGALTVPAVAVQQGQIGAYVWVVDEQNKAKATPVTVDRFEGDLAAISKGLDEGANVVIEGQAKLANGAEVRLPGAGQAAPATAATPQASDGTTPPKKKKAQATTGDQTP